MRRSQRFPPAPDVFWNLWEQVADKNAAIDTLQTVPAIMIPAVSHDPIPASH
jgi:hypothetical protein